MHAIKKKKQQVRIEIDWIFLWEKILMILSMVADLYHFAMPHCSSMLCPLYVMSRSCVVAFRQACTEKFAIFFSFYTSIQNGDCLHPLFMPTGRRQLDFARWHKLTTVRYWPPLSKETLQSQAERIRLFHFFLNASIMTLFFCMFVYRNWHVINIYIKRQYSNT